MKPLPSQECEAIRSRAVREILKEEVFPILDSNADEFSLSLECPLHPERDALGKLEAFRRVKRKNKWKCQLCRKTFASEDYINFHLRSKHANETGVPLDLDSDTICLADFCDIFQCQPRMEQLLEEIEDKRNKKDIPQKITCDPKEMERKKFKCISLLYDCFPPEQSTTAYKLNGILKTNFCDALTCEEKPAGSELRIESSGWSKWTVLWIVLGAVGIAAVGIFYLLFFVLHTEMSTHSDLKRVRRKSRLQAFWERQTKIKGY